VGENILNPSEVVLVADSLRVDFSGDELIGPDRWDASSGPESALGGVGDT
jgi:hypothetical protein